MRILMTGATGFLGSHLTPELLKAGHKLVILKRSNSDTSRIRDYLAELICYNIGATEAGEIFSNEKIELIIHLATNRGHNQNNIEKIFESNIILPAKLLSAGVKYKIRGFINADTSTASKYSLYSATKKAFVEIGRYFAESYNIKFVNLILEYFYGEQDSSASGRFVPQLFEHIIANKEMEATKGEQKRDFIYVADVVRAFIAAVNSLNNLSQNYTEFNIGCGKSMTLWNLVKTVENITGEKAKLNWGSIPYKKNEIFDMKADIESAKKILGWQPTTSLKEGLRKTLEWYKEQNG